MFSNYDKMLILASVMEMVLSKGRGADITSSHTQ